MMEEQEKLDLSIYFMSQAHKCVFALCYLDFVIVSEKIVNYFRKNTKDRPLLHVAE